MAVHVWPSDFDTYAALHRVGMEVGKRVHCADPEDSSLRWTIEDLARTRPGVRVSELAELLNLDLELAKTLARRAVRADGVVSGFDR